jgi:hypothetical protein
MVAGGDEATTMNLLSDWREHSDELNSRGHLETSHVVAKKRGGFEPSSAKELY